MSHSSAARARRRARILKKIKELKEMVTEAEKILSDISKCKMNFIEYLNDWNMLKSNKLKDELTSAIKVTSIFEGAVADTLSVEFPSVLKLMDENCLHVNEILTGITEQINNLNQYISQLKNAIKNLYNELASI